ncbi:hypothetical protein QTI66_28350 [Variovorax sp. J22R133]|uniref:hypothetical protein n=1 Tax=Variovorax brevis TaxID=3053503 RepID=UPI002576C038|nr:hypothetical protein [Variovorax sp. J22R133]MDM0116086.1 hypothetical protein [Variovorax sp. J22R133]
MMQFMTLLRASSGQGDALRGWYLEQYANRLLSSAEGLKGYRVNVDTVPPPGLELYGGAESARAEPYDLIAQMWFDSREAFERATQPLAEELAVHAPVHHVYRMSETVVLERPEQLQGNPSPGYKLMRGLFFYSDMPDSAVKRSWARHQDLAVKVHIGLARYVRHWVDEVLTEGAPGIRGMSDLHFPSADAMINRYFDSPRGRDEILHDIGHFIEGGTSRLFGTEYIYK